MQLHIKHCHKNGTELVKIQHSQSSKTGACELRAFSLVVAVVAAVD